MKRKKADRLLAAFAVALVATLGLVIGLGSTARADDTYTIAIINTNSSQIVYENAAATLGTAYTATLFGPDDDATIGMLTTPSVFESVELAGDKAIQFVAKSEGSDNMLILHPTGGGGIGRGTTFAVSVTKNQEHVPVTSVELNPATAILEAGKTAALKATVMPDNATNKSVAWKSSDVKVATVKDGVVTAVAEGKVTITATSVDNDKATATCVVTVKAAPVKGKQMFRLYNPNSGEHFYTANAAERDNVKAAGWTYEGVGWTAPESGSPVYRLYNENGGEHHYTTSKGEHDSLVAVGWKDEGVGWYSGGSKPLYRQYNPNAFANNHNYTTSKNERDTLLGLGWRDEGIAWYGI